MHRPFLTVINPAEKRVFQTLMVKEIKEEQEEDYLRLEVFERVLSNNNSLDKEWAMAESSAALSESEVILEPHENDVLMGRGGKNNQHSGNEKLRQFARQRCEEYKASTKKGKSTISRELVQLMRELDPPCRFLKRISDTGQWVDVGDDTAREKASQVLRDAVALDQEESDQAPGRGRRQEKVTYSLRESPEIEVPYSSHSAEAHDQYLASSYNTLPYAPYRRLQHGQEQHQRQQPQHRASTDTYTRRSFEEYRHHSYGEQRHGHPYHQQQQTDLLDPLPAFPTPASTSPTRSKRPMHTGYAPAISTSRSLDDYPAMSSSRSLDEFSFWGHRPTPTPIRRHSHDEHSFARYIDPASSGNYHYQESKRRRATATSTEATAAAFAPPPPPPPPLPPLPQPLPPTSHRDHHHLAELSSNLHEFDLFQGELLRSDDEKESDGSGAYSI